MLEWLLLACISISAALLASTWSWHKFRPTQTNGNNAQLHPRTLTGPPPSHSDSTNLLRRPAPTVAHAPRSYSAPTAPQLVGKKPRRRRRALSKNKKGECRPCHEYTEQDYMRQYKATPFPRLPHEVEVGNVEYKLKLDPPTEDRFQHLVTQMKFRLEEGRGHAFYQIGVQDNGQPDGIPRAMFDQSLRNLNSMAQKLGATTKVIKVRDGLISNHFAGEVLVRKLVQKFQVGKEIRVAICGDGEAGKSTLLGVLSSGHLDNGRGQARMNIFRHKHELENGRTSDIGREILGFDENGEIVNYSSIRAPTWSEIIENSARVISFMDLAGHKRYFKTTVSGMTGNFPDYAMLLVDAKVGVVGMTQEHYQLSLALKIPCVIVMTKLDICCDEAQQSTLAALRAMLQAPDSNKEPFLIRQETEAVQAAKLFAANTTTPIFEISNVTGHHLDLLRLFLSQLNPMKDWVIEKEKRALMYLDDTFSIPEVGTVVSGTLLQGTVALGDTLLLGPTANDTFVRTCVTSIHANRLPVQSARAGQSISVAINKVERDVCRKGQALLSPRINPSAVWQFDADVCLVTSASVVAQKYEAVIHCGCSQQTAVLEHLDDEDILRSGKAVRVTFRFKYHSEFLIPGDHFLFREGSSVGVGTVVSTYNSQSSCTMTDALFPLQNPISV